MVALMRACVSANAVVDASMRELSLVKARVFPDSKMQSGDCSYACQCTWRSVKEVSMIGIVESERQLCPDRDCGE